ncbi:MAG: putative aminohydrolase SsnA [Gemmatimonadota bacterium]|nr:putative aminohydrolase SsnA [Gemmatimonadota bacterium]
MSGTLLVANGTVFGGALGQDDDRPVVIADGAVAWEDARIVAVGRQAEVRRGYPGARVLDARGGLILPGLVNLHHHFYSALARGLDPGTSLADFGQVLDRLWWRLDRALDAETIRVSAELALADCIRAGCTTVFDHHASPNAIPGSLDIIAEAADACSLSAVLCYEVTDRNGPAGAAAGLAENLRFIDATRGHRRIRGTLGLHASFTLRDETLAEAARRRPAEAGCHIHVAEDPLDVRYSQEQFGAGPVQRLQAHGLLDARSLLAHGIHLERAEYETIAAHDAVLIHNPESNANNGVGVLDVAGAADAGCTVGLGTDGMSGSILRALRLGVLMQRAARRDPGVGFEEIRRLLATNARVARRFFDEPQLGELTPGAPADVIVVDAPPPTPLETGNAVGHLLYGAADAPVRHTVARGRILLEDFRHVAVDLEALAARARRRAGPLWERFHALRWGTRFLGS